ncbi:hypothetical protein BG003_001547, partial [Podila horticola]
MKITTLFTILATVVLVQATPKVDTNRVAEVQDYQVGAEPYVSHESLSAKRSDEPAGST